MPKYQIYSILWIIGLAVIISAIAPAHAQYHLRRDGSAAERPGITTTVTPQPRASVPIYQYQTTRRHATPAARSRLGGSRAKVVIPLDYQVRRSSLGLPCSEQDRRITDRFFQQMEEHSEVRSRDGTSRADQKIIKDYDKVLAILNNEEEREKLSKIVANCTIR